MKTEQKFVSAECLNQHATSVRSPELNATRRIVLVVIAIVTGGFAAFVFKAQAPVSEDHPRSPEVAPAQEAATEATIRFYLARVRRDPEETRSQNALAELYLQRVRETGNEDFLPLALAAARASLATVDAEQNVGGLTALTHAEFANHDFTGARDHALQLIELQPDRAEPFAILGDACLELGDYPRAVEAFQKMGERGERDASVEIRQSRLAVLRGETKVAQDHLSAALALLRNLSEPPRETIAWCQWQQGEIAFSTGDCAAAEKHAREALATAPNDFRALNSLGRVQAARGQSADAIRYLSEAVRLAPSVDAMAALGDLYQLNGRSEEAAAHYELVAQLGEHTQKIHGTPYDRALANFYANHDLKLEEAYALAATEFTAGRRDIYGADALAWTALKTNRVAEAQAMSAESLKLGTLDARLFYHAGMIAHASGDRVRAREYLARALALNPGFDLRQSEIARRTLKE